MPTLGPTQDLPRLERAARDLEAQLTHARYLQDQIKRRLQERAFASDLLLRDLKQDLAHSRAEWERLQQELTDTTRRESEYRERLIRIEQELICCQDQLRTIEQERSRLMKEVQGVYASLSWRITSPLRSIKAFLVTRTTGNS